MRLIDADAFAIEEPKMWDWSCIDDISSTAVAKQIIWDVQCAPTVDAIPVEWIESHITTIEQQRLIDEWRAENEQSNTCD